MTHPLATQEEEHLLEGLLLHFSSRQILRSKMETVANKILRLTSVIEESDITNGPLCY